MNNNQLPIPGFFDPSQADKVYRVPYGQRADDAKAWANRYGLKSVARDKPRICLVPIDVQNTFGLPDFELYVGGRSGRGAVDDSIRLSQFIYRNLGYISEISPTMDTHLAMQIFHPVFWVNDRGEHPLPAQTIISLADVENGVWRVNPQVAWSVARGNYVGLEKHALHYVKRLSEGGKYPLMIWPYHAMLGGVGHALVGVVEEAIFFHGIARSSQPDFQIKGGNPLTENYSVLRPEVLDGYDGRAIAQRNARFIKRLLEFDAVVIAGQAKSHCVAWTIADLLDEIMQQDESLARKVYLLEDCTSSVVVPGVIDFSDQADAAFSRFADAGMNIVSSVDDIASWPGLNF